jgi:hypothetical protein
VDEQADRRDDDQEARRQSVDDETDLDDEAARGDPGEELDLVAVGRLRPGQQRRGLAQHLEAEGHRDDPDEEDRRDRDIAGGAPEPSTDEGRDAEPQHRQVDEPRDETFDRHCRIASYSSTSGVFRFR